MKIITIILVSITFIVFMLSSLISNTTWFDTNIYKILVELGVEGYLNSIEVYSSLLLVFFIISNANYMIKVHGETKDRRIQKGAGLLFGMFIVANALVHYYTTVFTFNLVDEMNSMGKHHAKNRITDANEQYYLHGIQIEYFEGNGTIVKYVPTQEDIEIKNNFSWQKDELNRQPIYITVAFILMMLAFYLSSIFAKRAVKKHNKYEETNTNPQAD